MRTDVAAVMGTFLDGLRALLKDDLVGLYVYGALTFPDSQEAVRDIDYHVIVRHPLDDRLRRALFDLNPEMVALARSFGLELDGYVIAREDTRRLAPPRHQMWPLVRGFPSDESWALHCAHIRAGHVIVLHGPHPRQMYPEPTWPDLEAALYAEIRFVEHVLVENPAYAVLNACRLLYSFTTRDVVISKRAAAKWSQQQFPAEWRGLIEGALNAYEAGARQDNTILAAGVRAFVDMVWREIAHER